ncbi:uncharacterized protein [Choristoneura fumiferana]|uniref:uncharacterized protein n=1 Tax=Choristoneura fumiferana TaxID=7141 RepID=UPI003D154D8D
MSKRPHTESDEERWLRKLKLYEQKIEAKRRRNAGRQAIPPIQNDVQIEEHIECDEGISAKPSAPNDSEVTAPTADTDTEFIPHDDTIGYYVEYPGHDIVFDDASLLNYTTACTSPNSNACDVTKEDIATSAIDDFDPDLLQELGKLESEPNEFGDNLQTDVAARWQKVLLEGLKKEAKEDLLKKYPCPKNAPLAKSPSLNPEIGAMLAESCKLRDKRLLAKQDQLGKALSALGKALTSLLKKNADIPEIIRTMSDAGLMLADSHYAETDTRRSIIMPLVEKALTEPFKDRKRDAFLFGDKLGDLVKDSRGIKKTGQLIQPSPSNLNLNGRGPSSGGAQQQRSINLTSILSASFSPWPYYCKHLKASTYFIFTLFVCVVPVYTLYTRIVFM